MSAVFVGCTKETASTCGIIFVVTMVVDMSTATRRISETSYLLILCKWTVFKIIITVKLSLNFLSRFLVGTHREHGQR